MIERITGTIIRDKRVTSSLRRLKQIMADIIRGGLIRSALLLSHVCRHHKATRKLKDNSLLHKQTHLQILSQYGLNAVGLQLQDKSQLKDLSVVRHLPNRRLVCRGKWGNINVYVKLFFGADAAKYAARDKAGVRYLAEANLLTPSLLYVGELPKGKGCVLIFQEVENAENAETLWAQLGNNARLNLAKQLTKTIAHHHQASLLQTDLHLKNFLIKDEDIYTLDGDGIRKYANLSQQQALKNLTVLFSKFGVLDMENWFAELLQAYSEARGLKALPDAALIKEMTNAHRQKIASNYADKKVFRQCTDVKSYATEGAWILVCRAYENINFSGNLDALLTEQNLLKNGNTCTVALVEMSGKKIVIKRYNIKNFWHGISRSFRQTRAAVSWANAHRLNLLDIATAKPIGLIETRKFGLKGKAYFLAEYIDAPDAAQFFAKIRDTSQRKEAVKNIVTLFYKLYLLQISHGDTKATNIKMVDNQPVLIDLDSMHQHRTYFSSSVAHLRDLNRFMQNWQNEPALYNAFVEAFKVVYPDISILIKAGIFTNKEIID